ncbi:MAG: DUF2274 domain-containing protein [Pseudomonadota bacterium]
MTHPTLKLGPLPDRTPQKLSVALEPDLISDLQDYCDVFARLHGGSTTVQALIPHMLTAFLASDTGFKRARKQLSDNPRH